MKANKAQHRRPSRMPSIQSLQAWQRSLCAVLLLCILGVQTWGLAHRVLHTGGNTQFSVSTQTLNLNEHQAGDSVCQLLDAQSQQLGFKTYFPPVLIAQTAIDFIVVPFLNLSSQKLWACQARAPPL